MQWKGIMKQSLERLPCPKNKELKCLHCQKKLPVRGIAFAFVPAAAAAPSEATGTPPEVTDNPEKEAVKPDEAQQPQAVEE